MKKATVYLLIITLYCSAMYSCGKLESRSRALEEMHFAVDTAKLGLVIVSNQYHLRFAPPKNWEQIDSTLFGRLLPQLRSAISQDSTIITKPVFICRDTATNALLILSAVELRTNDIPHQSPQSGINAYKQLFFAKYDSTQIRGVEFLKDDIHIHQMLIRTRQFVIFKLLFFNNDNQLLQQDYIIPNDAYTTKTAQAVESSIGSLNFIPQ